MDASAVCPAFPRMRGPTPQIQCSHAQPNDRDLKCDYSRKNDVSTIHFISPSYHTYFVHYKLVLAHPVEENQPLTRLTKDKVYLPLPLPKFLNSYGYLDPECQT